MDRHVVQGARLAESAMGGSGYEHTHVNVEIVACLRGWNYHLVAMRQAIFFWSNSIYMTRNGKANKLDVFLCVFYSCNTTALLVTPPSVHYRR